MESQKKLLERLKKENLITPQNKLFIEKMLSHKDEYQRETPYEVIIDFLKLYQKFLTAPDGKINWNAIEDLNDTDTFYLSSLTENKKYADLGKNCLDKLIVLKLNGGLGTTMGINFTKSQIVVDTVRKLTFLDLIKANIEYVSKKYSKVSLWFLNSFNTQKDTCEILNPKNRKTCLYQELLQNKFPKIDAETKKPFSYPKNPKLEWNPPGHGDLFRTFQMYDSVHQMIAEGKKYLFISNSDNLGATIDFSILGYLEKHQIDFLMETTAKTLCDIKGGTVIRYKKSLYLLEKAQVPEKYLHEFEDINRFSIFNTNNIWINLHALAKILKKDFELPLIVNKKLVENHPVVQLETAVGSAIKLFDNAKVCVVPRSRFLPVKSNADLFLLRSDYIKKYAHYVCINPKRIFKNIVPKIILGKLYQNFTEFEQRLQNIPSLVNILSLTLEGDISFTGNKKAVLEGNIYFETDKKLTIKNNVILNDLKIILKNNNVLIEKSTQKDHKITITKNKNIYFISGVSRDYKKTWCAKLTLEPKIDCLEPA